MSLAYQMARLVRGLRRLGATYPPNFLQSLEGLLGAFIPSRYWLEINSAVYSSSRNFVDPHFNHALFFWEIAAMEKWFPPAPASVLVGAAGGGREACALLKRGYRVCAFEPNPKLFAHCAELRTQFPQFECHMLDYEQFMSPDCPLNPRQFDAIVAGWGSLSHVGDSAALSRLVATFARYCPAGTLLLSFLPSLSEGPDSLRQHLVTKLGGNPQVSYDSRNGIYYLIALNQIEALADSLGADLQVITAHRSNTACVLRSGLPLPLAARAAP